MMFYPMARAKSSQHAPCETLQKPIFDRNTGRLRARKFGARHRITHHQSNILYIYNMFISSQLTEIDRFEIFFENQVLLRIFKKKVSNRILNFENFNF